MTASPLTPRARRDQVHQSERRSAPEGLPPASTWKPAVATPQAKARGNGAVAGSAPAAAAVAGGPADAARARRTSRTGTRAAMSRGEPTWPPAGGHTGRVLLREDDDGVVAIGQASHAWLSGQVARAWGGAAAGAVAHREEACLAADQHDVGMALWDLTPDLDPATGLPVPFTAMPLATHLRLWSGAPQRLLSQSRVAALLVSMHGTALSERRDLARLDPAAADDVRAYLAGQRALQQRLAAETGLDDATRSRLQRQLFAWDWLSLALLLRWAPASLVGVPGADGELELHLGRGAGHEVHTLRPWPFSTDEVHVVAEGRRLGRRATTARELHAALEGAPRVALGFTLVPS